MTTLWNITTKHEIAEGLRGLYAALRQLGKATPHEEEMPSGVTDVQRAAIEDLLVCQVQIARIAVTMDGLLKLLPDQAIDKKAS